MANAILILAEIALAVWLVRELGRWVFLAGAEVGLKRMQDEAVERGLAEWAQTQCGPEFRWIEPQQAGGEQ